MSKKEAYKEDSHRRGREGESSSGTIMDDLLCDSKEDNYFRERGFEDGICDSLGDEHEGIEYPEAIDPIIEEVARGILASLSGLYSNLKMQEEEKKIPDPEKIRYYSEESKRFLQETQDFWRLDKKEIQKIFDEYGQLVKSLDNKLGY